MSLVDKYGRVHDYLRISLTDNCNLRCFYCMPDEDYNFTPTAKLMQADEISKIAKLFVDNGVKKIRLTGGEPLIRKDIEQILIQLSQLPIELSLTTNGILVNTLLSTLKDANLSSINVSLDTLKKEKFNTITRRDYFDRVIGNILLLLTEGFKVKINTVVMKDINQDEILDFVSLTELNNLEVRFIEFMPFSGNRWSSNQVVSLDDIMQIIQTKYKLIPLKAKPNDTSKPFGIEGHLGKIAVISTMTAPFCTDCNRIRLTADGKIKNCLFSKTETDILSDYRSGKDILPYIHKSIGLKAARLGGQFEADLSSVELEKLENRSMISIGG
jgi:cyclic pyranopterin phosphate synthase